jgi:hypothetical protein
MINQRNYTIREIIIKNYHEKKSMSQRFNLEIWQN